MIAKIKTYLRTLKADLKTMSVTRTEYQQLSEGLIELQKSPVLMISVMAESCLDQLNQCFLIC